MVFRTRQYRELNPSHHVGPDATSHHPLTLLLYHTFVDLSRGFGKIFEKIFDDSRSRVPSSNWLAQCPRPLVDLCGWSTVRISRRWVLPIPSWHYYYTTLLGICLLTKCTKFWRNFFCFCANCLNSPPRARARKREGSCPPSFNFRRDYWLSTRKPSRSPSARWSFPLLQECNQECRHCSW